MFDLKRSIGIVLLVIAATTGLAAQTHTSTRRTTHRRTTPAKPAPVYSNKFLVGDGAPVVAVLNTSLSTRTARNGDRFTMNVRQPSDYRNATITGHVSGIRRSGKLNGRSELTLNFDRIKLANGDSYRFAGTVESLRLASGERITVDNEGTIQEKSQTDKTVKRAGIGTAAGAIIGAIAGGGKGLAIGAIVGGGAGAGSVYAQGRTDLNLNVGTEISIRASSPAAR